MTDPWLPVEHGADNSNLQRRTARGATWALVDNWGRQLLQLAVFVVLARLLVPEDFGLVALAMVFVMLVALFVDQGLGDAIIQRRQLTHEHLDTAFWAALALGLLMTVAGVLLAIPIAALLNEPRLQPVLQGLSLVFIFTAFASVPMGVLRREMRFRSLAIRTLLSILVGGIVGVVMAVQGYGVWALVGQQLTAALMSVLVLWAASPWRPRLAFSIVHFRELFGFGANVVGSDLLLYLARYSDNFLVGTVLGTVALGIYSVGYRIMDAGNALLVGLARKVAFPALSRLQHDPARLTRAYIRMTRVTTAVVLPAYVGLALVAPELIQLVFGARWREAGPVAAVLFLVGPALALQGFGGSVLSAVGRPDMALRLRFVNTVTAIIGFAIAVSFGIVAVAVAFVIRGYLMLPLQLYMQRRYAGVPTGAFLSRLRGPVAATALMAGAVLAVKAFVLPPIGTALTLAAEIGVGVVVYLLAIVLFDRTLVRDVADFVAQALPGGERAQRQLARRRTGEE